MNLSASVSSHVTPYMGHGALLSRLEAMHMLTRKERDALVNDLADILAGERRRVIFDVMDISILSQFFMPSFMDYDDLFEFQRACEGSRRLFQNFGLFEVCNDGRLLDHNMRYRPLLDDGSYYSKVEDGPAVIDV